MRAFFSCRVLLSNASTARSLAEFPGAEATLARILVTGAAGFIGRHLCRLLAEQGHAVIGVTRRMAQPIPGAELVAIGAIGPQTDWTPWLDGVDVAIHLAGRAHRRTTPEVEATEPAAAAALARAAAARGVRRFVLMSSVKAMGETTLSGAPFRGQESPRPRTAYGHTKLATERAVARAAEESALEITIIRPPLVYGPGVMANFRALIRLVESGLPLPFAGVANRRSLIFVDDLARLAALAAAHPAAAGQTLLARGAADMSTPELLSAIAAALGRRLRLFPIPEAVFAAVRLLPVIGPPLVSLTASLEIDDARTRRLLGWTPAVPPEQGLFATVASLHPRR